MRKNIYSPISGNPVHEGKTYNNTLFSAGLIAIQQTYFRASLSCILCALSDLFCPSPADFHYRGFYRHRYSGCRIPVPDLRIWHLFYSPNPGDNLYSQRDPFWENGIIRHPLGIGNGNSCLYYNLCFSTR